ncbi:MAG: septum formation initiator family protein [Candidatus Omnitrophica bacterium]|nr:septum formation initiator family protein [Candidatus Omnitrophota bacterium]MCM8778008.1 septum formation initiator family protein [Candidatus Omnitrophota bacterium]
MRRKHRKKWLIGGLFICFILASIPRIKTLITYSRQLKYYNQEIIKLQEENRHLKEKIDAIKKDPYYAEKILRENYGYIRKGEYIYRIRTETEKGE